jgi:para-aminobenzoate synthetase/4-amino-4-deoxychorismate lyase
VRVLIDFCDPYSNSDGLRCAFDEPTQTLVAHTLAQVKPLLDEVEALSRQGLWCVGYVRYEAAPAFDTALVAHDSTGPLAWFGVYAQALPWPDPPHLDPFDTASASPGNAPATTPQVQWCSHLSPVDFEAQMETIHQAIAAGEFYQVNYTAPLTGEFTDDTCKFFNRLHQAQPNGYAAFIDTGFEQVLSVSPELFFDWHPGSKAQSGQILTRPMKGTAPRGKDAAEDHWLANTLMASPKERAENVMIVDLLRNDLSRIAEPFSVKVPTLFKVQTLPTVLQMVSDVTANTRPGTRLSDVFTALFPCGSVTGAPKVQAMRAIKTLEPQPRGIYCGAIGVVRPGGHATFNVAIRTVTVHGETATCGIGSGITADATANAEWREWQHKRLFLERASVQFSLLETLRLEHGKYVNLIAHLTRLERAARHFSYPFDEALVRQMLEKLAADSMANETNAFAGVADCGVDLHRPGRLKSATQASTWRVRLLLDASGHPSVEKFLLNQSPEPVKLALAATYFEASHSEFTRFKTTRRAHYEAFAPTAPSVFDTLLYNAQGELTECTRGNIALLMNGRWVTPPLHCGLLDGVGRYQYLQQRRLTEAVVRLEDLPRVQALAFINSLRGWLDARQYFPIQV